MDLGLDKGVKDSWSSMKGLIGIKEPEPTLLQHTENQCGLSLQQRMIGFFVCAGLGIVFLFLSFMFILSGTVFAVLISFAFLLLITSTFFLVGPLRQLKNMVQPTRLIASLVFVASFAVTLVIVFFVSGALRYLIFVSAVIEVCAFVWYVFSYIPYGRECLANCCKTCCGSLFSSV